MEYELVVGLEVHAELNTKSKIYCGCKNAFGLEVNTQICPICTGMPGTLPILNKSVVDYAIKMGHALNCKINAVSKQDRKNYFYPDLPKAYQISQSEVPLCEKGSLTFLVNGEEVTIGVTRIHIEEDAGKLLHGDFTVKGDENGEARGDRSISASEAFPDVPQSGRGEKPVSLADYNRCGVPLIEIVSEPDFRSVGEVKEYLETIKSILQYLDISDCKMQEGSIRCDVNVSVRPFGEKEFGKRCEMKNVNSFSAAVRGIEYEYNRQKALLDEYYAKLGAETTDGVVKLWRERQPDVISQETRRWDDMKGESYSMRSKEDAQDYRYFPEPDLLTIVVDKERIAELKEQIPELPNAKIKRYVKELGLSQGDAVLIAMNIEKQRIFDDCIAIGINSAKNINNWVQSDVAKFMNDSGRNISETPLTAERLCELIKFIEDGKISNNSAKQVFELIISDDKAPAAIIEEKGLVQISDTSFIEQIVNEVLAENEKSVADYKRGKTNAMGFLVGQCMKKSKGQANPKMLQNLVSEKLKS